MTMQTLMGLPPAFLFALLPLSGFNQQRLTPAETRELAFTAMPKAAKVRGVRIELDREQSGCAVYHAYRDIGEAPLVRTLTLGWWSVDLQTGEVWDELNSRRVTTRQVEEIQHTLRKRLEITAEAISASISKPCYDRY
jgi:hypothetical protein